MILKSIVLPHQILETTLNLKIYNIKTTIVEIGYHHTGMGI